MIHFPITLNTTYSVLVQEYIIKQEYNYILEDIDSFILLVYGQTIIQGLMSMYTIMFLMN